MRRRTVVITGAAGGLGREFALAFGRDGDLVVAADVDAEGAAETARLVQEAGGQAEQVRVDVTDRDSTRQMAERAASAGDGRIDVLINNAAIYGTIRRSPLEEIRPEDWDLVMAVNLKGPWLCAAACSEHLGEGSAVINMASATVYSGSEQWAHYVASKSGVIGLTRVMAKELGRRGIRVNALAPGFTLTEASLSLMEDAQTYGVDRGALRRASQAEDIVGAAQFLAGPGSGFVSGQTLVVDGGRQFI